MLERHFPERLGHHGNLISGTASSDISAATPSATSRRDGITLFGRDPATHFQQSDFANDRRHFIGAEVRNVMLGKLIGTHVNGKTALNHLAGLTVSGANGNQMAGQIPAGQSISGHLSGRILLTGGAAANLPRAISSGFQIFGQCAAKHFQTTPSTEARRTSSAEPSPPGGT